MYTKIIVASDGLPGALEATKVAAQIAMKHEAELLIVHVFLLPKLASPQMNMGVIEAYATQMENVIESQTRKALRDINVPYTIGHNLRSNDLPLY